MDFRVEAKEPVSSVAVAAGDASLHRCSIFAGVECERCYRGPRYPGNCSGCKACSCWIFSNPVLLCLYYLSGDSGRVGRRGGPPPPPNPPRTAATGQVFKIIFQDFGKIILKNNLEKKSRLFFKILAKIFLNKIIDFTT